MRITDSMNNQMLSSYLLRNRDDLYKLQEQTSSGLQVQRASDDPASYDLITRMNNQAHQLQQYLKNNDRLQGDLLAMDSKLQNANDLLQRSAEIIVSGGDGTKHPEDLKALGAQLDQMLEGIVGIANTAPSGSYSFAGLRQNVPAYDVQRDADGRIATVAYQGSDETRKIEIADGEYLPANFVGSDPDGSNGVFQTAHADLFADLIHARDRLLAGQNLAAEDPFTADPVSNTLSVNDIYATGTTVKLSTSGALPAGLRPDVSYYVIRVSDTEIQLAASLQDARAGVAINLGDAGSGDMKIAQQHLAALQRGEDQLMEVRTRLGAYQERAALSKTMNLTRQVDLGKKLEEEQDVDITKAIMELNNKQAAYEASMRVTMSTLQTTLMNYM